MDIEPAPTSDDDEQSSAPTVDLHGVVHISDLKKMHLSPLHFTASIAEDFEASRVMRVGNIAHHISLGPSNVKPLVRYRGGDRKGNKWKDFRKATLLEQPNAEIVTDKEWAEGEQIAAGLMRDPIARRLIEGARHEVPIEWESAGLKCATRGLDIVGDRFVADLKVTSCTEPNAWMRHALKLLYPQQMAFYEEGCIANGIDMSEGMFLIGVEANTPHAVTVLRMTEDVLKHGRKSLVIWIERLRTCRENDHWPGYTQQIVDFVLPEWMQDDDDD